MPSQVDAGVKCLHFHIDLHSGRGETEVDFLNGAVVRFGEKAGVTYPGKSNIKRDFAGYVRRRLDAVKLRPPPGDVLEQIISWMIFHGEYHRLSANNSR